jgi:hypothetical protein
MLVNYQNDQPVMITLDVKNNPVVGYKAGIPVNRFDIRWRLPYGVFCIMEPGL